MALDYAGIYKLVDDDPEAAYNLCKKMLSEDSTLNDDCELLWRLAKACTLWAISMEKKNPMKKQIIFEGRDIAIRAYALNDQSFEALRWTAVLIGAAIEFLGIRDKIREGKVFLDHLNNAIAIDEKDFTLFHLRGRFCYEISRLSWLEKKVANTIFSGVPDFTIDDALADFLEAEKHQPFPWAENLVCIARCYAIKKQKQLAYEYIKKIEEIERVDDAVREGLKEVQVMLTKK